MSDDEEFKIWTSSQSRDAGHLNRYGATLKKGPRVCKTALINEYGDDTTGEITHRKLTVSTAQRFPTSNNFDFAHPTHTWSCEDEEVDRLVTFLNNEAAAPGTYRLVDSTSSAVAIADLLATGNIDADAFAAALADTEDASALLSAIVATGAGQAAAAAAVQARRRQLVAELNGLARTSGTTESDMHAKIGNAHWLFGGRYIRVVRRDLVKLDQHDIALVAADGTLHIVELKGPCIPRLVRKHRNHWVVGNDVHEAVSQAMNYLRSLDEQGPLLETTYRNEFGEEWDMRRVHATVVIGHPDHVSDEGATERVVEQTIRSYNAHLSRIEVVTYKSLLGAADRALVFEDTPQAVAKTQPPTEDLATREPADPWSSPAQVNPWAGEPPF